MAEKYAARAVEAEISARMSEGIDPAKAKALLGWEATHRMPEVAHMLVDAERAKA